MKIEPFEPVQKTGAEARNPGNSRWVNALAGLGRRSSKPILLACLLLTGTPVAALTFNVNTTADTLDANTADGICADAAGNCSLRAAVMQSNASSGADTINLPAGTYALTIGSASDDLNASAGDLDLAGPAAFVGAGADTTIIDAAAMSNRIFETPVELFSFGAVSFSDLTLRGGNSSGVDGAAAVDVGTRFVSQITFNRVVVTGNTGGSAIRTVTDTVINDSVVSNNSGAGLSHSNDSFLVGVNLGTLDITNSTFEGNGFRGIGIGQTDGGSLVNSTVSGNGTDGFSAQFTGSDDFLITNSTIAHNGRDGVSGLGFTSDGFPVRPNILVRNSIVANNIRSDFTTPGAAEPQAEIPQSGGFNVISDASGGTNFTQPGDLTSTDPMLAALALNPPGTTRTHALLAGSPAIDNASASFAPPADQRGIARPQGAADDSGAFEFLPTISDLGVTKTADVSNALLGDPVVFTVEVTNSGPDAVVGAAFSDTPDASFGNVAWTCQAAGGASCTASGSGAINDSVDLPVGAGLTYTVNALIAESAQSPAVNTASIAAPAGASDPNPGNNQASASISVDNSANLELAAVQCIDLTAPALTHQFAVQLVNTGPNAALSTTVDVEFPADFNLLSAPPTCTESAGVLVCDEGTLSAGQGIELVFFIEVDGQAADGPRDSGFLAASARPDNQPDNNAGTLTTTVLANLVATDSFESCGDS